MKNIFLSCLIATISNPVFAQLNITLLTSNMEMDSVRIINYSQTCKATVLPSDTMRLHLDAPYDVDLFNIYIYQKKTRLSRQIWLNKGDITIQAHQKDRDLVIDTVINAPIYDYVVHAVNPTLKRLQDLNNPDSMHYFVLGVIEKNKENAFSATMLYHYINNSRHSEDRIKLILPLVEQQSTKLSWFNFTKSNLAAIQLILHPPILDLNLYAFLDKDSVLHHIQLEKGKYTVLDFWFLTCPPCRRDHKSIKADKQKLDAKGIQLISVTIDRYEIADKWSEYLQEHEYTWVNYFQTSEKSITSDFQITTYPTYWVLDDKGQVVFMDNKYDELKRFLGME
jgi:thiol-disulfide isomerase/thioredoxin